MADRAFGGSLYDTPFKLEKEAGNKFKVVNEVERTMDKHSEIPFLRTQHNPSEFSKTYNGSFGGFQPGRSFSTTKERQKAKNVKRLVRKEAGWNNYVKPISKYNTHVHPSMRIAFE